MKKEKFFNNTIYDDQWWSSPIELSSFRDFIISTFHSNCSILSRFSFNFSSQELWFSLLKPKTRISRVHATVERKKEQLNTYANIGVKPRSKHSQADIMVRLPFSNRCPAGLPRCCTKLEGRLGVPFHSVNFGSPPFFFFLFFLFFIPSSFHSFTRQNKSSNSLVGEPCWQKYCNWRRKSAGNRRIHGPLTFDAINIGMDTISNRLYRHPNYN